MLSDKIKTLRTARGINQIELAKSLGVTKQCVSNWENDNIQPSVEMLIKIASFFMVTTDYLLGLETERKIILSGLTEKQIAHLSLIIDDLQSKQ
ncbi:MAG: helix-turn-helix transcriptional regulator [Clostridia bacterium]|jgi:transcriptional regulator with XRE-family HTH domain|nr:helix-turn-helix transcriptional regulator [Clostridia bacterium]